MDDQSGDPEQRRSISGPPIAGRSKVWTEEEDRELLKQAGMRWRAGMLKKNLVNDLSGVFKHRSAEAIRKRLQKLKWPTPQKAGVEVLTVAEDPPQANHSTPQHRGSEDQAPNTSQFQEGDWRTSVLEETRGKLTEPRLGAEELVGLVEDLRAKRISIQQGGERIELLANKYFPDMWKPTAPRELASQKPCSNKQLR